VIINGYTQPGAIPNTNTVGFASNAVLQIELSGDLLSGEEVGLRLATSGSTIRGLVINHFPHEGIAIEGEGATGNTIAGNFIGTDVSGATDLGNGGNGVHIIDSANNAAKMRDVLERMVALALKLVRKEAIGLPKDEGYIARRLIRDQFVAQAAGERLVDMVLAKVKGEPFESEMMPTAFAPIPMPPGVKDLRKAKVMLITDGGLVPKGNPDKIEGSAATRWGSYSIKDCADLHGADYEISHGGYDAQFVRQDPDRLVPLDVMRELEKEGAIGELHDEFLSTSGLANPLSNTRRMGREMAEKAKRLGIDAIILTST